MRLNYALAAAALFLLTSQSAQADSAYDAVDALFAPGPTTTVGEPLSVPKSTEAGGISPLTSISVGLVGPESSTYSGQPHARAIDDQPSIEVAVTDPDTSGAAPHKSKTSGHVAVPEPSALAMGAVALMFFLYFFRRRRLG